VTELLDHVGKGDEKRFGDFCTALTNSGQKHIVDKLCEDGAVTTDAVPAVDPTAKKVTEENAGKLCANWNYLTYDIRSDSEFLGYLRTLQVFTPLQMQTLQASN